MRRFCDGVYGKGDSTEKDPGDRRYRLPFAYTISWAIIYVKGNSSQ